jgi:hypothetical protein
MRIFSLLTGGIDLPKLSTEVASLRLASEDTNAALADHIVKANARMATIERVQSDNTAQCQIRMNGLQDLIASRALAEDVETLRLKVERVDDDNATTSEELHDAVQKLATIKANQDDITAMRTTIATLSGAVASLSAKVEALTATKLSEVKARKAPKKDAAK